MKTLHLHAGIPADLARAAEFLRAGGLVAFPTETVYGLGANALDAAAVRKIFAAKDRPAWDPVIVHLASREMLPLVAASTPPGFEKLAARFMPGPLTLLLPKTPAVPAEVTAGRSLVGVRIPAHPVAQALIRAAGVPVAAPSANRFGRTSPTTAAHVLADLDGRIDAVLDAGPATVGVESTVLDLSTIPPTILRQGGVTREQIETVIGPVRVFRPSDAGLPPPPADAAFAAAQAGLPSPGTSLRHYAPRARMVLVEGLSSGGTETGPGQAQGTPALTDGPISLESALSAESLQHSHPGILLPSGWKAAGTAFDWGRWGDWPTLAARLYAGMRWLDDQGVSVILAPVPPDEGLGSAISDRLRKAAR
jgi:L-threonylcarbamoyladenylate synthase